MAGNSMLVQKRSSAAGSRAGRSGFCRRKTASSGIIRYTVRIIGTYHMLSKRV